MKKIFLFITALLILQVAFSQAKTDDVLLKILQKHPDKFASILSDPAKYRVQILYTQIDRDKKNMPTFKSYAYRLNKDEYFYPASTVKFPACLLALEKANKVADSLIGRKDDDVRNHFKSKMAMLSNPSPQLNFGEQTDPTNIQNDKLPTLAHHIKKILLVSDNEAFNRLYEFMGQSDFNTILNQKGYNNLRISHRLSRPLSRTQNAMTNPIDFVTNRIDTTSSDLSIDSFLKYKYYNKSCNKILNEGKPYSNEDRIRMIVVSTCDTFYRQPALYSNLNLEPKNAITLGKGYMTAGKNYYAGDSLVNEPFDFTYKNYFALEDQQAILRATLFPEAVKPEQRFNLSEEDYNFMYKYMSMSPMESNSPVYRTDSSMYDSYCKFLMFGNNKSPMPKNIRIFNKVGDAYGFLLDNAYIVDFEKGVEFMLSVVMYCNADGIFNDDKYDYETVGFPFMANLGKVIYDLEVKRKRKVKPNLTKFKIDYTNRTCKRFDSATN